MRKLYYRGILIIGIILMGIPLIGESSWKDDVCVEDLQCKDASKGYTAPYCVLGDVDYSYSCNFPLLTNSLSSNLKSPNFTTKDMVSQYCESLLGNQNDGRIYFSKPNAEGDPDWTQTYDSHQSLFVYLLCSSIVDKKGSYDFSEIFKGDAVKLLKLQQISDGKNKCSLKDSPSLDGCDMSFYATEIFSVMMSDIFKVKYAEIFHVNSVEKFTSDPKERVMTFLSGYFGEVNDEFFKMFPNTVDVIDSNQQYYKAVLETLKLLENGELADKAEESGCPGDGNMVGVDFIACALHGSHGKGVSLDPAFETLFYNEIMFYRIFVSNYSNWVKLKLENLTEEEQEVERQFKATNLQFYSDLQVEAAKQTLQDFEDLNMTYPLHIGLLLYQEKLKEYRNQYLPPIVKLFYSLSEKLQNVQLPE